MQPQSPALLCPNDQPHVRVFLHFAKLLQRQRYRPVLLYRYSTYILQQARHIKDRSLVRSSCCSRLPLMLRVLLSSRNRIQAAAGALYHVPLLFFVLRRLQMARAAPRENFILVAAVCILRLLFLLLP